MKQLWSKEELQALEHKYRIVVYFDSSTAAYTAKIAPFYSLKETLTKDEVMEHIIKTPLVFTDEDNVELQFICINYAGDDESNALAFYSDNTGVLFGTFEDYRYYISVFRDDIKILEFSTED